ncbi:glutamine synthetase family protein [Acidithiobacillus sp. AMEEHan]|uniref:glutamine synthetase family protein n=1 Tax=Acidithiobacillus sp. AMEEHan TaxID=2994951 RepID=UPI0027E527FC|nr:glutamine synthetase family protein [Acidithiobacillus sp. AMEEHan]
MKREPLVFAGVCDWSGLVRGKAFPVADLASRLKKGVGLTHSNIMMSCFGPIFTTPFGTEGDLIIRPDPQAYVEVVFEDDITERFYLSDITNTDGTPWDFCPRTFLKRALDRLEGRFGLHLLASFEQEFVLSNVEQRPGATYALDAFRRQGAFGEKLLGAMRLAGFAPDSFLPEYGPGQYEATLHPEEGLRSADAAVVLREMARALAWRSGGRAIFAPMLTPDGIGNGTHIHMSLWRGDVPVTHDPAGFLGLGREASAFFAGILDHMSAVTAFTAPSVASYYRLTPNRWAPVHANIRSQDRGAALRVAPIFSTSEETPAAQFNVEFRVADASASPYLALGSLVWAGLEGLERGLSLQASPDESQILPRSLMDATAALQADAAASSWWSEDAMNSYIAFKNAEIAALENLDEEGICKRYSEVY